MPARFESALVGLDLSPVSDALVEWLPVLARIGTRRLVLLHVVNVEAVIHVAGGYDVVKLEEELRKAALERLNSYRERLEAAGFQVEVPEPPVGSPGATLAAEAERLGVDYIVVATHGMGLLRSILLGSTTEELLHRATRSVLVARLERGGEKPAVAGDPFRGPILAALAFDEYNSLVAECARLIASRAGAKLILLHVLEEDEVAAVAEKAMEAPAGEARAAGVEVEAIVTRGRPAKEILKAAEEAGASLIVMGPRAKRSIPILGSVTDQVVRRAKTHVLVCHQPPGP